MGATITESINISVDENVNVSDVVGVTDVVTVLITSFVLAFSTVAISEDVNVLITSDLNISVSEVVGVAESVSVLSPFLEISESETVTVNESVGIALENSINVNETVTLSESVDLDLSVQINTSDSINVVDSISVFTDLLHIDLTDSVAVTENVGISVFVPGSEFTINVSELVFIADFPSTIIPAVGDRHWIFESPPATGAWTGRNNQLATVETLNPTTWSFVIPKAGYRFYSRKHKRYYFWDGIKLNQEGGNQITVKESFFAAGFEDNILVDDDAAGTEVIINMPPIANSPRRIYDIKKIGSTADVIITGEAGQTIDGQQTQIIDTQYDSLTLVLGVSEWEIQ